MRCQRGCTGRKVDRWMSVCAFVQRWRRGRWKIRHNSIRKMGKNEDRGDQIKVRRCYEHRDSSCLSLSVCSAYVLLSRVMDRSISEASNFDGRGSGDKVCCYCRRLSRCVSILRTPIRHRLICNNYRIACTERSVLFPLNQHVQVIMWSCLWVFL